jgi:hypothetical protein
MIFFRYFTYVGLLIHFGIRGNPTEPLEPSVLKLHDEILFSCRKEKKTLKHEAYCC